ncbi:hypothetical protein Goari_011037, partial [Gossypium aridum]|nr:hypothetical protein [Gossypium aridum]
MNSHSIPCLFRATVITALFQRLVHRFTDSTILLLHPYSFSSCNRASPFFRFLQRLRNSSGKGGHLFLPSSSFILSDVSLPLIA